VVAAIAIAAVAIVVGDDEFRATSVAYPDAAAIPTPRATFDAGAAGHLSIDAHAIAGVDIAIDRALVAGVAGNNLGVVIAVIVVIIAVVITCRLGNAANAKHGQCQQHFPDIDPHDTHSHVTKYGLSPLSKT